MKLLALGLLGLFAAAAAQPGSAGNRKVKSRPTGKPPKPAFSKDAKQVVWTGDYAGVKVNGLAAKFTIFNTDKAEPNGLRYHVGFQSFFQAKSAAAPWTRLRAVNLAGYYDWGVSSPVETSNTDTWELAFNMTSVAKAATSNDKPHPDIQFRNYVLSNENGASIKFDFTVDNFKAEWWHSEATHLVLAYKISANLAGQTSERAPKAAKLTKSLARKRPKLPSDGAASGEDTVTEDVVAFEGADFASVPTFLAGGNVTKPVGLSLDGDMLYLAYEKFDTTLVHDPTLDLNGDASNNYEFSAAPSPAQVGSWGVVAAVATLLTAHSW